MIICLLAGMFYTEVLQAGTIQKRDVMNENLIELAQQILLAAKTKESTDSIAKILELISPAVLKEQLKSDNDKKAFWLNIYNAFTQIILTRNPDKYKNRSDFFKDKQIRLAGRALSLDDIEHGLLRRSKSKLSFGYFNKLFPGSFERANRVDKLDYRIHFALNCGAKSCPPIAFYSPESLDKQLDLSTKVYLRGECDYNMNKNEIGVPALMGWFRHDFGGRSGMKTILRKVEVISQDQNPDIYFKKYDWSLFLENYKSEQ